MGIEVGGTRGEEAEGRRTDASRGQSGERSTKAFWPHRELQSPLVSRHVFWCRRVVVVSRFEESSTICIAYACSTYNLKAFLDLVSPAKFDPNAISLNSVPKLYHACAQGCEVTNAVRIVLVLSRKVSTAVQDKSNSE